MPLAMLTLGVDIDSTIEVCINLLSQVADYMAGNRYKDNTYLNARNAI